MTAVRNWRDFGQTVEIFVHCYHIHISSFNANLDLKNFPAINVRIACYLHANSTDMEAI